MRLCAIVVGLLLTGQSFANEVAPPWASPEALTAFAKSSDRATIHALLYQNDGGWSSVKAQVAAGDPAWIDAAKVLRRATDGGMSSELRDAMFQALRTNPAAVLSRAEPEFHLNDLCRGRADPLPTLQEALAEQSSTVSAVAHIEVASLQSQRKSCLAKLREGRADLHRFFKAKG